MDECMAQGQILQARQATMTSRIDNDIRNTEERLTDLKRAKQILDENPAMQELLNLLTKANLR